MRKILFFISVLVLSASVSAQNPQRAEALFTEGDYSAALPIYAALHKQSPKTPLYTYRLARCEQELGKSEEAILHFEEAGERYVLRNFYLGELYFDTYRFEQAQEAYAAYLENISETHERYDYVVEQAHRAERAARLLARIEDVAVIDSVSFPPAALQEYVPLSADQGKIIVENGEYSYLNQRGDRRYLAVYDSLTSRRLICCQQRLLDDWSALDTLPESVNKFSDHSFPFLMPDGLTLYYAARSESGLGGWDIYMTKFNPATGSYLTPEMLGMPFCSPGDDILYYIDEASGRGYFFSNRSQGGHWVRYTFLPSDRKSFLRDSSNTYLRTYARMEVLRMPAQDESVEMQPSTSPAISVLPVAQAPSWRMVINDSTVYTSLEEFRSADAKAMAEQYLDLLEQIDEENEDLQLQRKAYVDAETDADKKAMRPILLSLEKDLVRLKHEAADMLKQIRRMENR